VAINGKQIHIETLLIALNDMVEIPERKTDAPLRVPISGAYKIKGVGDVLAGRVEQGVVKPGDEVIFLPTHTTANPCVGKVFTVEMHHKRVDKAGPGDNVGMNIKVGSVVLGAIVCSFVFWFFCFRTPLFLLSAPFFLLPRSRSHKPTKKYPPLKKTPNKQPHNNQPPPQQQQHNTSTGPRQGQHAAHGRRHDPQERQDAAAGAVVRGGHPDARHPRRGQGED
jgi:hypothetical protein